MAFAQEQITITTYYPSPYGSYRELISHRMKIGTTYSGFGVIVNDNDLLVEGNVGIGRIPTANRLEVEGNASKAAAGDWLANSDARIKTDIRDLENAIDIISKLHPVKFRYNEEYRAKHPSIEDKYYYNFIAQEFQEVFPESVSDDGTGYLQIDTHNVKIYLVAAVKKLSKITKIQQQKIDSLEGEITKLKTQLDVR